MVISLPKSLVYTLTSIFSTITSSHRIGGRLAEHFGFKWVYGVGLFLSAIGTLLIPIMAKINFWAFFAIRFIIGVFEGFTIPAIFVASARFTVVFIRPG